VVFKSFTGSTSNSCFYRDIYELIKEYKAFTIHVVCRRYEDVVLNAFRSLSSRDTDKFAEAGLKLVKAQKAAV
jgi:flavin reductase (DIM6/NTAB) family NADH-FMN oxidoreductase RutF